MKILFIQTGGSIDKTYPKRALSYAFEISEPASRKVLQNISPNFEYDIISLLKKDSLDMDDGDRESILKFCKDSDWDKIIITHGTDTMIESAKKLSQIKDKVIIFTGAVLPERFIDSDASFNLGFAIGAINYLKNGVYIAMQGRIYEWNKCKKAPESGRFVEG
jgi:L-asparaginase